MGVLACSMAESQTADTDALTVETPDGAETVTVPETFSREDCTAWSNDTPEEWSPDRVYIFDAMIHAETITADGNCVGAIYYPETKPCENPLVIGKTGWVVEVIKGSFSDVEDPPGETLWTADDDD